MRPNKGDDNDIIQAHAATSYYNKKNNYSAK